MGLGIIQLIIHDWSKFSPSEWFGYLQFNNLATSNNEDLKEYCFLHHQNRNPHHFEYWITCDRSNGAIKSLRMPICYVTEMVVDWIAANRAYNSSQELLNQERQMEFLRKNKNNIHPETRKDIRKEIIRLGTVFKQFKMEQEFSNFLENEFQQ
ncbi:predicted protein [Naegleria gruberi]|uniref:Predicted protein n=1 Tax=Naegleria gruberi TaxID=5762 RepID=D2VP63_NAEGR|nr:uncharacterized protein NAEGRDRAFT_70745 [Naegleria gruberi]EFC41377.1 predicted protein [Naegleria gruberi]|eukprot:XP_002674121.1 predicted protein [Naegleria gruberi strain NEG-M]